MNPYDLIKQSLYNSITKIVTNNPVIHSHQGKPEPSGTYVAINVLRLDRVGMEYDSTYAGEISTGSDTYEIDSRNEYEAVVRLMFVGKDSGNIAHHFDVVMDNPAARFYFGTENLAVMRKSEVRRVPEKRDTEWVENFTLDIFFSYAVETAQPIDIIETVTWNEKIN